MQRVEMGSCANIGGYGASGDINTWTFAIIPISAGAHTLTWSYEKDPSVDTGVDAAGIDDVVVTAGPSVPGVPVTNTRLAPQCSDVNISEAMRG